MIKMPRGRLGRGRLGRGRLGGAAVAAAVLVCGGAALWLLGSPGDEGSTTTSSRERVSTEVSAEALTAMGGTRVFLGHQSVGANVMDGLRLVYQREGQEAPPVVEADQDLPEKGGLLAHALIGANEDPLGKIQDFDRRLRAGLGGTVDVALMKLCYIDIRSDTDVDALFTTYRDTLRALERDYPDVTFLHATVPLTTEAGFVARMKTRLGGSDRFGQAENVARERLNTLIRREYPADRLLDLAAIESTAPDGTRASGRFKGQEYHVLHPGYALDEGHLNDLGASTAAAALVRLIDRAERE